MHDPWNEGRNEQQNEAREAPLGASSPEDTPGMQHMPKSALAPGFFALLWRNLGTGFRLAMGRAVAVGDIGSGLGQIVALVLVLLLLNAGVTFVMTVAPVGFDAYGLNYLGAIGLFSLLILMLVSRLAGSDVGRFVPVLVAFVSASVVISLVSQLVWAAEMYFPVSNATAWSLFIGLLFWQGLVVVRLLRNFIGAGAARAWGLGTMYVLTIYASFWVFPRVPLWYTDELPQDAGAAVQHEVLDVESIFYAQQRLMQQSLSGLKAQRPGVADLYFMAVGGFGLEDVFLKEVEFVQAQFDYQYDTAGRSMILANNPATVNRYPLANRPNLAQGLAGMAQKMDTDEDVLFLFMTSHGSRDHRFSLEFGAVKLNDLTPQQLRAALDDAGIRWRVILVSSCYSGGFIEDLQSPETLVITAAAADRTSFGCGVDSDFTYFGTAYFKQALRQQPKFIQAFDIANAWVSDKEQREAIGASNPQMFAGEAIAQKLDTFYREPGLQAVFSLAIPDQTPACEGVVTAACKP